MSILESNIVPLVPPSAPSGPADSHDADGVAPAIGGLSMDEAEKVRGHLVGARSLLAAIGYGELLVVPPSDGEERRRHATALSMLDLLEQELNSAIAALDVMRD